MVRSTPTHHYHPARSTVHKRREECWNDGIGFASKEMTSRWTLLPLLRTNLGSPHRGAGCIKVLWLY